jgi:hypothetical protein
MQLPKYLLESLIPFTYLILQAGMSDALSKMRIRSDQSQVQLDASKNPLVAKRKKRKSVDK